MLTEAQAVTAAEAEFAKSGRVVSDYIVTIESYPGDSAAWIVWFNRKGPFPVPGGKHAVRVDKTTGRAVFMPGE